LGLLRAWGRCSDGAHTGERIEGRGRCVETVVERSAEQRMLDKCVAALGGHVVRHPVAGYLQLLVTAINEPLQRGQVFTMPGGRAVIVCDLTREEFRLALAYNARVRQALRGPDLRWICEGDRPDLLRDTGVKSPAVPEHCVHCYLCRRI
jgi:hypothetical protein